MVMVEWMVAAYHRTCSPRRLAWSEGWRPPGAQFALRFEPIWVLNLDQIRSW